MSLEDSSQLVIVFSHSQIDELHMQLPSSPSSLPLHAPSFSATTGSRNYDCPMFLVCAQGEHKCKKKLWHYVVRPNFIIKIFLQVETHGFCWQLAGRSRERAEPVCMCEIHATLGQNFCSNWHILGGGYSPKTL